MKHTTRITAANAPTIHRLRGSGSYSLITGGCAAPRNRNMAIMTMVMNSQLQETQVITMAPSTVAIEIQRDFLPSSAWVR
jgi:hypothetical protein